MSRKLTAEEAEARKVHRREYARAYYHKMGPEQKSAKLANSAAWKRNCSVEQRSELKRKSAEWKQQNREADRAYKAKACELMAPYYIAPLLGLASADLPVELLELKREQLTVARLARELKRQLKETDHDSSEQQPAGQPGQPPSRDDHG